MGDMGEFFNALHQEHKAVREKRIASHVPTIEAYCIAHDLVMEFIQPWQIRIFKHTDPKVFIDLYPGSKKIFYHGDNSWGHYQDPVVTIKKFFHS